MYVVYSHAYGNAPGIAGTFGSLAEAEELIDALAGQYTPQDDWVVVLAWASKAYFEEYNDWGWGAYYPLPGKEVVDLA